MEESGREPVFLFEGVRRTLNFYFLKDKTMRQFRQVALGLTILGSIFAATNSVQASDCQYGQPKYKTYTVYQAVKVPHYSYVTKYHPCGTPYRVQVVSYRTVTAPVQKKVRIGY